MRVVTFDAVAYGRRMYGPFQRRHVFVGVAGDAECQRSRSDELYAGDIFVDPDFMAAQTAHRNGGMDGLAFRLVFVALEALGAIGLRIERNGVNGGGGARNQQRDQRKENQDINTKSAAAVICGRLAEPDAMGEQSHTASEGLRVHEGHRITKKLLRVVTRA